MTGTDPEPMLIEGASGSPGGILEVRQPFDRSLAGRVSAADASAARLAIRVAAESFADRDACPGLPLRLEALSRAAARIENESESWAAGIAREGGKPIRDARVEVARAVDGLRHCAFLPRSETGKVIPMDLNAASAGRVAHTRLEPVGVVLAYSAFNHPLNLLVHQVGPALAAGCPVLLKPSEATPLTAIRFVQLLRDCGIPPAWIQTFVVQDRAIATALVTDNRLALFSFIGSARVGWGLRSTLAPGVRCVLEHGGAAPMIVMPDADWPVLLPQVLKSAFVHAGQVCVSTQRIFVVGKKAREFAEKLALETSRLRVGNPLLEDTEVGPLIRPSEVVRMGEWMEEAVASGAEVLCGGTSRSDTCYAPTVLWNPGPKSRVMSEEVFGPVVSVIPVTDLDEAIRQANAVPFAFQSSIYTRDLAAALRAADRLEAGTVLVNDPTTFRVDWMPFGGHRLSGQGTGGLVYTYRDCLREKLVVMRT